MIPPIDPNLDAKKYLVFVVVAGLTGGILFVCLRFGIQTPAALAIVSTLPLAVFAGAAAALVRPIRQWVLAILQIALTAIGLQMSLL